MSVSPQSPRAPLWPREEHLVSLVSEAGEPLGVATVDEAHRAPGSLHRAFSVLLFDGEGRTLLQQRSERKTRFPLRWANTCCGHPAPGEDVRAAAALRLEQELGVRGVELTERGVYLYRAADEATGRVEHEYDHVLVGRWAPDSLLTPDPSEVAGIRWASATSLIDEATGSEYAPWFAGVLSVASIAIDVS